MTTATHNALEQFHALKPQCAECASPLDLDPRQLAPEYSAMSKAEAAAAFVEAYRNVQQAMPDVARMFDDAPLICRRCEFTRDGNLTQQEREARVWRLYNTTFQTGALPEAARFQKFANSDDAIEALNRDTWKWARSYDRETAWISGTKGTGKTFMGRCILHARIDHINTVMEVRAHDVNAKARQFEHERYVAQLQNAGVLLIDDIDKAAWTRDGVIVLNEVMDARYAHKRPTLITANVEPEFMWNQWRNLFADNPSVIAALFDRLTGCKRVVLTGESLRRASA